MTNEVKYVTEDNLKLFMQNYNKTVLKTDGSTEFTPYNLYDPTTKKYVDEMTQKRISLAIENETASNLLNGSTDGSLRMKNSATEKSTYTIGEDSVTLGLGTQASGTSQLVFGEFNKQDTEDKYFMIIGNGTADRANKRSNCATIDKQGNLWLAGGIELATGGVENTSNLVTTIDNTNTDVQYPSAKAVYTYVSSLNPDTAKLNEILQRLATLEDTVNNNVPQWQDAPSTQSINEIED